MPTDVTEATASWRDALEEKLSSGEIAVPVLPRSASQVMTMVANPDTTACELSELVHGDPALAAIVLKIANSAVYGGRTRIVSLQQAIARLGIGLLGEIAYSSILHRSVFNIPEFEAEIHRIWKHALATGLFSKHVARSVRHNVENAFLCGLLHSIGKPVILREYRKMVDRAGGSGKRISSEETDSILRLVESHHSAVGSRIARQWGLPESVCSSIAGHEMLDDAADQPPETAIVHVAVLLAHEALDPSGQSLLLGDDRALMVLNLYPEDVEEIRTEAEEVIETVEVMCHG